MSGSFVLLLLATMGARASRRPAALAVATVLLVLAAAGVIIAGPQAGLPLPFLDWREAWALETTAAIGLAAWLLADGFATAHPVRPAPGPSELRLVVG